MHRPELGCVLGGRNVRLDWKRRAWDRKGDGPRVEFKVMVERDRLFPRLGDKVDSNLDLEFAPAVGTGRSVKTGSSSS